MVVPQIYKPDYRPNGFKPIFGTHAKALLVDGKGRLLITNGTKVPLPYGVVSNLSWKGDGANYDAWRYRDSVTPGPSVAVYNFLNAVTQDFYSLNTRTFAFSRNNIPANRTDDSQVYALSSSDAVCYDVEFGETFATLQATASAVALPNASWTYALLKTWHALATSYPGTMRYAAIAPVEPLEGGISLNNRTLPGFESWSEIRDVDDVVTIHLHSMVVRNHDATATLNTIASGSSYRINGAATVSSLQTDEYTGAVFGFNGRDGGRLTFNIGGTVAVAREFRRRADRNELLVSIANGLNFKLELWRCAQHDSSALTTDKNSNIATEMPRFELMQTIDLCSVDVAINNEALNLPIGECKIEIEANRLYFFKLLIEGQSVHAEDEIDESAALPLSGDSMSVNDFFQVDAEAQLTLAPVA